MKFSNETIAVLKNFSTIRQDLFFKEGNTLTTSSPSKTILAHATLSDKIERDFGIYDLSMFLGTLSLFDEYDLNLNSNSMTIVGSQGNMPIKVSYTYAAPEMINRPSDPSKLKDNMDLKTYLEFDLKFDSLKQVISAATIMGLPEIAVVCGDNEIKLHAFNSKDPTSNTYDMRMKTADQSSKKCTAVMLTENFRLQEKESYKVEILVHEESGHGVAHFYNSEPVTGLTIEYWIVLEANQSSFE